MITSFTGEHRFLSNFFPSVVVINTSRNHMLNAKSVEHGYQAMKADGNDELMQRILHASTPGLAKRLGRKATLPEHWEEDKLGIMYSLLQSKFKWDTNPQLTEYLMNTGPTTLLIEGNTWDDRFWGQCPVGSGLNALGMLLMQVRGELIGD